MLGRLKNGLSNVRGKRLKSILVHSAIVPKIDSAIVFLKSILQSFLKSILQSILKSILKSFANDFLIGMREFGNRNEAIIASLYRVNFGGLGVT